MNSCPVCGSLSYSHVFSCSNRHGRHLEQPEGVFQVLVCVRCGLMGPGGVRADAEYYRTYYPSGYHGSRGGRRGLLHRLWDPIGRMQARRKIRAIRRWFVRPSGRLRLLDVGCGAGAFLRQLDPADVDAKGLEPAAEAVQAARHLGLSVEKGDILSAPLPEESLDVITLWHVLEHLDRPDRALTRIHTALRPGGLVVMTTPNTKSLACRAGREFWYHLDIPRHLHLFNEDNLATLLENTGFEVIHCAYCPLDFPLDLFWSVRREWRLWPALALYPLFKLLDRETFFLAARKRP